MMYDFTSTLSQVVLAAVQTGECKNLPKYLAEAAALGIEAFERTGATGHIDLALDRLMYTEMRRRADRLDCEFILEYVQKAIDLNNLKAMLRIRAMEGNVKLLSTALADGGFTEPYFFEDMLPKGVDVMSSRLCYKFFGDVVKLGIEEYAQSGNYALLEKLADDHLMEHLKKAKMVAFGPEPLFAYLYAKETEIKQVRMVITAKINQIPNAHIKKRLRECYA